MNWRTLLAAFILWNVIVAVNADNGSLLWFRNLPTAISEGSKNRVKIPKHTPTLDIAVKELRQGWQGLPVTLILKKEKDLKEDGFRIQSTQDNIILTSPSEIGLLYGTYHLLRLQETGVNLGSLQIKENPAFDLRILNHWDNPDGTIERGYAGHSLWKWTELPDTLSERYRSYARANASIGINATVLNNVNASYKVLDGENLRKVKALADIFRPYGIRVYLSINFASPMQLGGLSTADPLDKNVREWWRKKVKEIYQIIPDFGGFLVKANSEGQPGPCDFGRTHADGANMLADALKPYKGIVMWRAFVYNPTDSDRAKQAYLEFSPLDNQFRDNVIVQIKNGPIDFQPREPYSPLFGAMPRTSQMVEFQITQEYTGFSNHLVYLAPMWKEFFNFVSPSSLKGMAGVANIGDDDNWCGHPFAQANWYAFGRLAWNPKLTSEQIADEWLKQTFCQDTAFTMPIGKIMSESREAVVDYMMPLGLHHIFAWSHHYGPEPWCKISGARADWLPSYYHKADKEGVGFDRSRTGSNAVSQYPSAIAKEYDDIRLCPEKYLLWFHHVPWNYKMKSGHTLWEELCYTYDRGVQQARDFQKTWDRMEKYVDPQQFKEVQTRLRIQVRDAVWWKDACLLYFGEFSGMPIPYDIERPIHSLDALKKIHLPITNDECPTEEMLNKVR